jgi:ornithine cyclodeaminase/alanine dehydrogenase-like protein (mu-crystallin family)
MAEHGLYGKRNKARGCLCGGAWHKESIMLYLSRADTQRLDLRMSEVVPAIEEAFRRVGNGQAVVAPRTRVVHPPLGKNSMGKGRPWVRDLRIIPGAVEGIGYGVRLGTSLRRQAGGVILVLFDWETMELAALISDHLVHAVRSTAPCGVMAKYLALENASTLALIGSGRLARWAAEAVCAARPIRDLRVWSPTPAHRRECVDYLQSRLGTSVRVHEVESSEAAIRGAAIVTTGSKALEPVMRGEWISPGCTILANSPEEIDQATFLKSKIVTTYNDGILSHVPPYHSLVELVEAGKLSGADLSTELGDIVTGKIPGRISADEIIVGLNPAFGILDAATAEFVYRRAKAMGVGRELEP